MREEFGMGPTRKDVQYFSKHDPEYVNQLKEALEKSDNEDLDEGAEPGISNQEYSMQMWQQMEQNYTKL